MLNYKNPDSNSALTPISGVFPGAHIRGGVGGCNTPPALENCKKSVQNSLKIVEKVGPVGRSPDVYYT